MDQSVQITTDSAAWAKDFESGPMWIVILLISIIAIIALKPEFRKLLEALASRLRRAEKIDAGPFSLEGGQQEAVAASRAKTAGEAPVVQKNGGEPVTEREQLWYEAFRYELIYRLCTPGQRRFLRALVGAVLMEDAADKCYRIDNDENAVSRDDWTLWLVSVSCLVTIETTAGSTFYRLSESGVNLINHITKTTRNQRLYIDNADPRGLDP